MSAGGEPVPWAGTLTTTTVGGKTVLAENYETVAGWVNFPLYTFSGDQPYSWAACTASSACRRAWPPVLTSGGPGRSGVPAWGIGELSIPGGLTQVSWEGHPLYLFSHEELAPASNGAPKPAGNGNGVHAFGGTFSLVVNP
jgi:predicted lipoprotein with Yx(FWY)xxD motif